MSDPYGAAERFVLTYVSAGEMHMDGRSADDVDKLAAADFLELIADGPEATAAALLHVLDVAVDFIAQLLDQDRVTVVRSIVAECERRRAAS